MRWEQLFEDLESQLDRAERDELDGEVSDRTRIEVGRITLAARLGIGLGRRIGLLLTGGLAVRGELRASGPDWLVLLDDGAREWLLPLAAVLSVSGLPLGARPTPVSEAERMVSARLDLRRALRGIARDRSAVQLHLVDGLVVGGTLDRVGADHVDLAEHPPGEWRRAGAVSAVHSVPLWAVAGVARLADGTY